MESPLKTLETYLSERSSLSASAISEITGCFRPERFKKNAFFARQGETSDRIGFIVSGFFRMFLVREDGSLFTKMFVGDRQFLLAVFDVSDPSTITAQAVNDSWVLCSPYSRIQDMFRRYPEFDAFAKKEIEDVLLKTYTRFEQLATMESTDRYLLFKKEWPDLEDLIPQHMIASYLAVTPTQLSRIRKKLSR